MKKLTNEKKVMKVLTENPGIKPADIGRIAKVPMKSLYGVLYKLVGKGTVVRKGRGVFYLADGANAPVTAPPVREDKRVAALNKENEQLRKDNEEMYNLWKDVAVTAMNASVVITYLEGKLKEAYGHAGKQG